MDQIHLTISHWVFILTVLSIIVSIALRKGVIIPSILGIFVLGLLSKNGGTGILNNIIFATQVIFRAMISSGKELFDIMLVISLMVAMLKSLQSQGADHLMIAPVKRFMAGPWTSFFVLSFTMYVAAAFFWPTPAIALVGTVLIPVAIRAGLPAIGAAIAVNLAGHGMALSADPVIQGATRLTARSAGISTDELLPYTILFSLCIGFVAIAISCYFLRLEIRSGSTEGVITDISLEDDDSSAQETGSYAKIFAFGVPVVFISIALLMIYRAMFYPDEAIRGGAATALLGGTATVVLVLSSFAAHGREAMDGIATHLRDGFFFSIKIFAPIIPIAGFFFLGNPEQAVAIMGKGTPGFLFDIGNFVGHHLGGNPVFLSVGVVLVALLTGMDGSGFSGLPLVGSLAGALGRGAGIDVAVLAALAQVTSIFSGGGTLIAWAFGACADAGISGVDPTVLVRRNLIPVLIGIFITTIIAMFIMT